ncbi:Peptidyl-prolyl cis-trans isomerase CWC27 like protein, partial [Eufriesea mexicana]
IIKGFVTQDGDPTGTGEGVKIHGEPFKDEFPTRLRFCRRALIAMAKAEEDDNGFQFFFTLISTPDFQNKHTIFGKVTQGTIYNMLKLEEVLVNENDEPLCPPKLIKTIILNNPLADIIPRIIVQEKAEEDEEESVTLYKKFSGKGKSAHDHLTDPKLSSQPAVGPSGLANNKRKKVRTNDWVSDDEVKTQKELGVLKKKKEAVKKRIKSSLKDTKKGQKKVQNYKIDDVEDDKDIKETE